MGAQSTHMDPKPPGPPELSPAHVDFHTHILSKNNKVISVDRDLDTQRSLDLHPDPAAV